ncbi:MAG: hypothetical protein ACRCYO_11110, partial [Bacteroidia bacterium]
MKQNLLCKTALADVYEPESGILYAAASVDFEITLEMAEEFNRIVLEATNKRKICILFDGRSISISQISPSVMKYSSSNNHSEYQIAIALLINGRMAKNLASVYIRIFRPIIPTRLF